MIEEMARGRVSLWDTEGSWQLSSRKPEEEKYWSKEASSVTTWKNRYDQEYEIPERQMPKRTRDQETLHCEVDQLTAGIPKIRRING
jgi:hypothetical protein